MKTVTTAVLALAGLLLAAMAATPAQAGGDGGVTSPLSTDLTICHDEPVTPACAVWLLSLCEWRSDPALCAKVGLTNSEFLDPIRAQLIAMIEAGIERGEITPCDAAALVDLVVSVADGALIHRATRGADTDAAIDVFARYALHPLRLSESRR